MITLLIALLGTLVHASVPGGQDYLTGKQIRLKNSAKPRMLVFLSTQCPCSTSHLQHVSQLAEENPELEIIGVHSNQNETSMEARKFFAQYNVKFPIIRDQGAAIADKYGAIKTPQVIITKADKLVYSGPVSNSRMVQNADKFFVRDYLAQMKSGATLVPVRKKPLGCYIDRG